MSFPTNPTNNQIHIEFGKQFIYNATKDVWSIYYTTPSSPITVSDTAPENSSSGHMWLDSTELKTYIYYTDPDNESYWLPIETPSTFINSSIDSLLDVDTTTSTPTNGQALIWNSETNNWVPNTISISSGVPKISAIEITDENYTVLDDTAVSLDGGYIKLTGTGFESGCQLLINNTPAISTTYISQTEVRAQVPSATTGTYIVYLVNADGGVAIRVNGITYSAAPTWVTGSEYYVTSNMPFSTTLVATDAVSYQIQPESSLPSGLTLASDGLLSGTVVVANNTVYNFTIDATDAELQNSSRTISLTVSTGTELFIPDGTTLSLGFKFNNSELTKSGSLATTLQQSLTYQTSGGVNNSGYATGWDMASGISIDTFTTISSTLNRTYIAWYKGTQTASAGSYSPSVPIFGTTSNSVYWGFGLSAGKICIANGGQQKGTTNIATDQWFCLAWTVTSGGVCNGFVNGVKELSNISVNTGYPGPLRIGAGYNYTGCEAPTALDAIAVFDGVLTDAQILEIYENANT